MHNPSSCTSRCPSAFLSVSLVPIVCTPPSVATPLRSSSVHPRVPSGSPGVLCLLSGAVFALVPAGQSPWLGPRGEGLALFRGVLCFSGSDGVCVGVSVRLPQARVAWLDGTPALSVAWRFSGPPAVVAATSVL